MDNPIPRPAGLAVLITIAIAILAPGAMDPAGPSSISHHALTRPTKQQLPKRDRLKELPERMSEDLVSEDLTTKDLPADIRTARLMLSVESLFKATTTN